MAASATFALKPGVWFRRARLDMVSPDSQATACLPSGRNSTYRPVQISGTGSFRTPATTARGTITSRRHPKTFTIADIVEAKHEQLIAMNRHEIVNSEMRELGDLSKAKFPMQG